MTYFQQLDETDCGAACIGIIASHFGKILNIAEIRKKAGTDVLGTNLNGLLIAGKKYGLKGIAVKGNPQSINSKLECPFIVHLHKKINKTDWIDHYVVVSKISQKRIQIWDPNPLERKKKISIKKFLEMWTGYAVFFEPDITFKKTKKESLLLKFIPVFLPHIKTLIYTFLSSIILLIFGIIISFYYKYIFDEVIYSKSIFSLHSLTLGILLVTIIQVIVGTIRSILLSHFSFKTDLQLNFSYLEHIFDLPVSFFESRKSGEILSRLGDLDKIKQTISSTALSGIMDTVMLIVSAPILLSINKTLFGISHLQILKEFICLVHVTKLFR